MTTKVKAHLLKREPGRSRRNGIMTGEVAQALRQAIFEGEFQPGDPLPELHLAKRFGVSQAIIREALANLGHLGLTRRFPNKGTFVTSLSAEEISQHVRLRLMLEATAWLDAADRARPSDFDKLQERIAAMLTATQDGDYFETARADLEFHREIWRISGDATLLRILDQITLPIFAFVSMRRSQRHDDLSRIVPEHQEIADALRGGRRADILRLVRSQTERSYRGFFQDPERSSVFYDWLEHRAQTSEAP